MAPCHHLTGFLISGQYCSTFRLILLLVHKAGIPIRQHSEDQWVSIFSYVGRAIPQGHVGRIWPAGPQVGRPCLAKGRIDFFSKLLFLIFTEKSHLM